ncbi:hypothetical protein HYX08_06825 [Candidatus Woesearchaeota archaeon]|nr:hypothetical protein [Candidatus Woesearchaeota archaeon]
MMLDVPFYENKLEGNQCMQASMKSVLKHFLDKEFSLQELDRLTGRKKGFWTWTSQIVTVLHDLGLDLKYYSKTDLGPFLEGEPFIRKHFGKDADKILKFTDLPEVMKSIKKLKKYGVFEKKRLSFDDIANYIKQQHVPLMLIDWNKIAGIKGSFQGHLVVVTGFDEENVFYHESGPRNPAPDKQVSKKIFMEAWNANGTDNDVVIVFGKRKV